MVREGEIVVEGDADQGLGVSLTTQDFKEFVLHLVGLGSH